MIAISEDTTGVEKLRDCYYSWTIYIPTNVTSTTAATEITKSGCNTTTTDYWVLGSSRDIGEPTSIKPPEDQEDVRKNKNLPHPFAMFLKPQELPVRRKVKRSCKRTKKHLMKKRLQRGRKA